MTAVTRPKKMSFRTMTVLMMISLEMCRGSEPQKSYGPPVSNDNNYQNSYDPELHRPLAVFTEKPVNVAGIVLIPVVQVPSSDLRMIYKPQIDSVSKTEPIVMCKSSTKSVEATPAVQVPLQQPFYLYDERTLIPFPKTLTILHGGYRVSIPVGIVVAPIPAGAFKSGPVFVTTLFAIPVGPLLAPSQIPVRFVPWSAYPQPPHYSAVPSSSYSAVPSSSYSAAPSPSQYTAAPSPPQYTAAPSPPQYTPAPSPPQYTPAPSPPQYSQPAPPGPAYYQHSEYTETAGSDLRYRDPPGKLYSQYDAAAAAAAAAAPPPQPQSPFYNSKESPVLHQLREESEKNRHKYGQQRPQYSNPYYQTVDA